MSPIHICPNCQQRYSVALGVTDFEHNCNSGDTTLDNEDVLVLGDWEDYTGSGTVQDSQPMTAGATNTEFGTDAAIRGADVPEFTNRGNDKETTRVRKHKEYIDLRKC